jgi:hypothetical protein
MVLWTGRDAARLYSPAFSPTELHAGQRNAPATKAHPLLLLLRLTVESAFKDALRTRDGVPTTEAIDAVAWIEADLDWTARRGLIPPPKVRQEIVFTFAWCCSLLDLDPETIRISGLRHIGGLSHHSGRWLPGLPEVYERWRQAREQHEGQHTQPLQQQQEAMAASV